MAKALSAVLIMISVGTFGFWIIEGGETSLLDCFYMTIITLSTVGYGEVIPLETAGRLFASLMIVIGMGSLIYFGSTVIAFWVEFDLRGARRRKKMEKLIGQLSDHVIVCGVGVTGSRVVRELVETKTKFVMIDINEDKLQRVCELHATTYGTIPHIQGDATQDRVLADAGIDRAMGVVAALRGDKDNLYLGACASPRR
jgi:voltage-gated potassium channel